MYSLYELKIQKFIVFSEKSSQMKLKIFPIIGIYFISKEKFVDIVYTLDIMLKVEFSFGEFKITFLLNKVLK